MPAQQSDPLAARSASGTRSVWVIPCYNESHRLDSRSWLQLIAEGSGAELLFVNDGSTDDTETHLRALAGMHPGRINVLSLARNGGKGEAVRQGLRCALDGGADIVGYADADLATPVEELRRMLDVLRSRDVSVLLASRVALLGRQIERRAARHYLGRVFSTAASIILALPVYDTQCGAKLFKRSAALESALATPFLSRWVFDVELLGRLTTGPGRLSSREVVEEPLYIWRDKPGSKITPLDMVRAIVDIARINQDLRRRRRAGGGPPLR